MTEQYRPTPHAPRQLRPAQPQPRPRKPQKWPWIVSIVAAFVLGIAFGAAGNSAPGQTAPPASSPPATAPAANPAATPGLAPAASGPKTEFGDGTYLVGTDIAVGSYKSSGPRPGSVPNCYWARMKDDSGSVSSIIANSGGAGPTRVTVKKGEYVQITGCDFTKA